MRRSVVPDKSYAVWGVFVALAVTVAVLAHLFGPEFGLFSGFIICLVFFIVDRVVCLMEGIDPNDEPTDVF